MQRYCLILTVLTVALSSTDCQAQWYGRWGRATQGTTPYSAAVNSQAAMAMARGAAAANYARAEISNEQARSLYLQNEAAFIQMRRENRDAIDARNEQRKQQQKEKAASRPTPKPVSEIFPPLSSDQLDPVSGTIHWPDYLMDKEYAADRKIIEDTLRTQAEFHPNDRTTKIIYDAAVRMMHTQSRHYADLGPENYANCRRFLHSLSVEGNHAQEKMK